jgi:RES domain-containing protein
MPDQGMRYQGLLYRALNPIYARNPLSGEGARKYGGRFNPKGMAALYTSLSIMTAIREANQLGTLQPTVLVAYEAEIGPIFDATLPAEFEKLGLKMPDFASDDWRSRMLNGDTVPTQQLAIELKALGYAGMQVRSFAKGASSTDLNMVLWSWSDMPPTLLRVVDDEGRLV